jgi:hypothetical protein
MRELLQKPPEQASGPIPASLDQLWALRDELTGLKDAVARSLECYRAAQARLRERLSNPPDRPHRPAHGGGRRRADLLTHIAPPFGLLPTAEEIDRLCAPIDVACAGQPRVPWRRQLEVLRAAVPPEVRERLLPLPPAPEESLCSVHDRLLSVLVPTAGPPRARMEQVQRACALPAVLHDAPYIASDPWLSHSFLEKLELELASVNLSEEPAGEPARASDASESDVEGDLEAFRAQVEDLNRGSRSTAR